MLAETSNFWTDTYPLVALGTLVVALLCYTVVELKAWISVKVRRTLLIVGLLLTAGEVVRSKTAQEEAANSATLYIYSEKRGEVALSLDGQPVQQGEAEKATGVRLKKNAPNVLEVRQGADLVGSLPLTKGIYAVNCSSTVKIACEEVIYSSSPRMFSTLGDDTPPRKPEFLLRGQGRGIFPIQKRDAKDYITGFSETPPASIQTSYKAGQAPAVSMKTMWWLHTEK
ncbi:hypothetical protein [Prosthecobacter dejongeii]|uniref:Uncharacterized protein n=1 Tax=Prosthecobacter dejongeii TaxID=48465 RepID=A0A7W8DNK3_9BACT|nr:hypothetical protein [Prosthecobacter dejongeii]MBB5036634.1 hypothetical protein [Prosthecobacter dejongeii]